MAKNKQQIFNLLKPVRPPANVWDKIYEWLVGRARIVIMVAEVFIAIAFFAKVVVDTQAKEKQDKIDELSTELQLYTNENGVVDGRKQRYVQLQRKEEDYTKLWNKSSNTSKILSELYSYIPNQASEISLTMNKSVFNIAGSIELATLQSIEKQVDGSQTFYDTEIGLSIENATGVGSYSLTGDISEDSNNRENIGGLPDANTDDFEF